MEKIKINLSTDYEIRTTTHQKKKHLVVPVVMMVEGVHHGSAGAVLHKAEELGKIVDSWNGIPVTIQHPQIDGNGVSANIPEVIDSVCVGRVYNAYMDGVKLKAEVWLEEKALKEVSESAYEHIQNRKPLDVSVGIYSEDVQEQGEWNGEAYEKIASNYRPDHLALLPGGEGACGWNDGCGIRNNNRKEANMLDEIQKLITKGFQVFKLQTNEESLGEIMSACYEKLRAMNNDNTYHYLQEVYPEYLVYQVEYRGNNVPKLFKQGYALENGKVTLNGDPEEVKKEVNYVSINTSKMKRTKFNNNSKFNSSMAKEDCGKCMEKIVNIINNNSIPFNENDREWLLQQDEAVLDKILSTNSKPAEQPKELTPEQVLNALSKEDKDALQFGKNQLKAHREGLIKGIQENSSKELWPDDVLNKYDNETLERVFKSVKKEESKGFYGLNSGAQPQVETNEEVAMYPVGVEIDKK